MIPVAALGALAAVSGLAVVLFRSWAAAAVLSLGLGTLVALPAVGWRMEHRLAALFGLWAVSDFAKKLTFLVPDQQLWAQFGPFLLPFGFFALAILIPWARTHLTLRPTRLQLLVGTYLMIALVNTWLSGGAGLVSKAAATALLVMPWSLVAVSASYPRSLSAVCRVFVVMAVASALYAGLQFVLGPTPIELGWARATGELSIGASHLTSVLSGSEDFYLWRIIGFQADEFTFALFMLNGITAAWLLHAGGELDRRLFWVVVGVLLAAIGVSLVRTAWVAAAALIGYVLVSRRVKPLTKPLIVMGMLVGLFFAGDVAAITLEGLKGLAQESLPPVLRRSITFGTLDARSGATAALFSALGPRAVTGQGYAASDWITNKFGGFDLLPDNFSKHNALVELLWYVGIPGLAVAGAIVFHALRQGARAASLGRLPREELRILLGYLICMYLTGLSVAGVFLSFPFFYFLGILAGSPTGQPAE
jgi:hypothetical protein